MLRNIILFLLVFLQLTSISLANEYKKIHGPKVVMDTSMGQVEIEIFDQAAPLSAANFLRYVEDKFYDGLIFHRVIPGFVVQGGGLHADLQEKPNYGPVKNEAKGGKPNRRGTLAMARTNDIDSATSQFFFNLKDSFSLDHKGEEPGSYGYTVFAQVTKGMEVIDQISQMPTTTINGMADVPIEPISIIKIRVKE